MSGPYAKYAVPWWWAMRYSLPQQFSPSKAHIQKAQIAFAKTKYTIGAPRRAYFPESQREDGLNPLPEIVVIGQPNAGKSSLIKSLVPEDVKVIVAGYRGTTKIAHFYNIGRRFFLVDLPGYETDDKEMGNSVLREVLQRRKTVKAALLLVDVRAGLTDVDQLRIEHLETYHVPYTFVVTKCDKAREWQMRRTVNQMKEVVLSPWKFRCHQEILLTSCKTGVGVDEVGAYMAARTGLFNLDRKIFKKEQELNIPV